MFMYLLEPRFLHLWNKNDNVYIPDLWGLKIFDSLENLRPVNSSVSIVLCQTHSKCSKGYKDEQDKDSGHYTFFYP